MKRSCSHLFPEATHYGKVVAIDIDSDAYVIDDNSLAASKRLLTQNRDAKIWCVRVGHRALHLWVDALTECLVPHTK